MRSGYHAEVVLQNDYRLPPYFEPDDVIVDIGGHIGAFAHACLVRGAGKVISCEPEPGNLELLRQNLARWGDRVEIIPAAVWPDGESIPSLAPPSNTYDTCQFSMVFHDGGALAPTILLDEVLARAPGRVRLLKLDCEGAEYAILRSSQLIGVQEICGEAHEVVCGKIQLGIVNIRERFSNSAEFTYVKNGPLTHLWWTRAT